MCSERRVLVLFHCSYETVQPLMLLYTQGAALVSFLHDGAVAGVAFSPTAPQLGTACGRELALWSPESHMVFKDQVRSKTRWTSRSPPS